jgi:hypothetical protein
VVFASHTIDTTGGSAYGGHIEIIDLLGTSEADTGGKWWFKATKTWWFSFGFVGFIHEWRFM